MKGEDRRNPDLEQYSCRSSTRAFMNQCEVEVGDQIFA